MADVAGPIPPPPATVTYPWVDFNHVVNPNQNLQYPASPCFYYAGMQAIWVTWSVSMDVLQPFLASRGMVAVPLSGNGAVTVCFFNAACLFGNGTIPPHAPRNSGVYGFNETELNIVACAATVQQVTPMNFSVGDFLTNGDPTKRIGVFRQWVAADDEAAVAAGQQVYKENKFLASYTYSVPTWNNPSQPTYDWTCYAAGDETHPIYTGHVDLSTLGQPVQGNMSEWVDLSYDTTQNRVMGSRRNFFGTMNTYELPSSSNAVRITFGDSTHPMRADMQTLLQGAVPVAIQVFQSPPVIAEGSPYWADL